HLRRRWSYRRDTRRRRKPSIAIPASKHADASPPACPLRSRRHPPLEEPSPDGGSAGPVPAVGGTPFMGAEGSGTVGSEPAPPGATGAGCRGGSGWGGPGPSGPPPTAVPSLVSASSGVGVTGLTGPGSVGSGSTGSGLRTQLPG